MKFKNQNYEFTANEFQKSIPTFFGKLALVNELHKA